MTNTMRKINSLLNLNQRFVQGLVLIVLLCLGFTIFPATMAICDSDLPEDKFKDRSLAIMPVFVDSEISAGEVSVLNRSINAELDDEFSKKFDDSKVMGTIAAQSLLSSKRKTDLLENVIEYYEENEVFDLNLIDSLQKVLHCDFIILSLMEVEQYEVEFKVFLIDLHAKTALWESKSEFERGSIMSLSNSELNTVAKELVEVAIFRGHLELS